MDNKPERIDWFYINNEPVEMNTANTTVYQYLGAKAVYDHLYVDISDIIPGKGVYIWSHATDYVQLVTLARLLGAEIKSDLPEVHPTKLKVYEDRLLQDLVNLKYLPESW